VVAGLISTTLARKAMAASTTTITTPAIGVSAEAGKVAPASGCRPLAKVMAARSTPCDTDVAAVRQTTAAS
jgi:hypothetical protein